MAAVSQASTIEKEGYDIPKCVLWKELSRRACSSVLLGFNAELFGRAEMERCCNASDMGKTVQDTTII